MGRRRQHFVAHQRFRLPEFPGNYSPRGKQNKLVMNETEQTTVVGTCLSMCPLSEVALREREILIHPFEVLSRTAHRRNSRHRGDPHKMVKAYSRPAAGRVDPSPCDLRPSHVLLHTVHYLLHKIVPKVDCHWYEVYDFVSDRLRAVRQDMIIQDIRNPTAIQILENIIQFHVFAGYRLCTEPTSVFDPQLNDSHTQECLKRLLYLYQESAGCHDNRVLFESIYLLYNLGNTDSLYHYLSLDKNIRNVHLLNLSYRISVAFMTGNYIRVLRLIKSLPSLICLCAVHRHFAVLKRQTLQIMSAGFSSKNLHYPLAHLTELLPLDCQRETEDLCVACGLSFNAGKVQFVRVAFKGDASILSSKIQLIDDQLSDIPLEDIFLISSKKFNKLNNDENWVGTTPQNRMDLLSYGFDRLNIAGDKS